MDEIEEEPAAIKAKRAAIQRLQPYQFKKGQSGNPSGRPAGKSLKDYTREMLAAMTDEERQEFLHGIPKIEIFRMAEGNPDNKLQGDANNPITLVLKDINGNSIAEKLRAEGISKDVPSSSTEV